MKLRNKHIRLVMLVDGQLYPILAICSTADEANQICQANPQAAVIDEDEAGRIYVASKTPIDN